MMDEPRMWYRTVNVCVFICELSIENVLRWLQVKLTFKCALSHYLLDSYVECTRLKMARGGHLSCILKYRTMMPENWHRARFDRGVHFKYV